MAGGSMLRWVRKPGDMMLRVFLWPGNVVCDALDAGEEDDRSMIRSLINMLVWGLVAMLILRALW